MQMYPYHFMHYSFGIESFFFDDHVLSQDFKVWKFSSEWIVYSDN